MSLKVYLAGAWTEQHFRARPMMARLREAGVEITFDWSKPEGDICSCGHPRESHGPNVPWLLKGCGADSCACTVFNGIGVGSDSALSDEDRIKFARLDLDGVLRADVVWLLAPHTQQGCGSWVEFGVALTARKLRGEYADEMARAGWPFAHPHVVVSGPKRKRTIFTQLADTLFEDDEDAFRLLRSLVGDRDPNKESKEPVGFRKLETPVRSSWFGLTNETSGVGGWIVVALAAAKERGYDGPNRTGPFKTYAEASAEADRLDEDFQRKVAAP